MSEERAAYSMIDGLVIPVTPGVLLDSHVPKTTTLDLAAIRDLFDEVLRDAGHDYFQAWSDPDEGPRYRKRLERKWDDYEASVRKRLDMLLKGGV